MKKCVVVAVAVLCSSILALGQSMTSSSSGSWGHKAVSNLPDCTSASINGALCWQLATSLPVVSNVFAGLGHTFATTAAGAGYHYNRHGHNWLSHPEWGVVYGLYQGGDGHLYSMYSTCGSGTGHLIGEWNGSTFVNTGPGCAKAVSFDPTGTLMFAIGTEGFLWESTNYGGSWTSYLGCRDRSGALSISGMDATGKVAIICNDKTIWTGNANNSGSYTQLPGAGFVITNDLTGALYVIGTDNAVYHWNTSLSRWDKLTGTWATSLANGGAADIWAVGGTTNGHNMWRFAEYTIQFSRTYQGSVNCNVPPPYGQQICAQFNHTATVQIGNGMKAGTVGSTQWNGPGGWGVTSTVNANNLFDCLENDPDCAPAEDTGNMQCSGGGSNSDVAPWSFQCLLQFVPPRKIGWSKGSQVNVYISNHYNSSEESLICAGIESWVVVNANSYSCSIASAPPAQTYTGKYIWVTYNAALVDTDYPGEATAYNDPCGPYHKCPNEGANLKQIQIGLGSFFDGQLQGALAHEEGHSNFLDDCYSCGDGASVMGSQPTWAPEQPVSPTSCDILWSLFWWAI